MICPNCGEDFSDSFKKIEGKRNKVYAVLPHYGDAYQIKGIYCPSCGVTSEFILQATGNQFHKRKEITSPQMLYVNHDYWQFLKDNKLINKFTDWVKQKRPQKEVA